MEQEKKQNSQYQIISMMDLRKNIGAVINEVVYKKRTYLIERRGKPLCILDAYTDVVGSPSQLNPDSKVNAERLFGSLKHVSNTKEEWTNSFDQAEHDYQARTDTLWDSKK